MVNGLYQLLACLVLLEQIKRLQAETSITVVFPIPLRCDYLRDDLYSIKNFLCCLQLYQTKYQCPFYC